jgi:hypothetical protein
VACAAQPDLLQRLVSAMPSNFLSLLSYITTLLPISIQFGSQTGSQRLRLWSYIVVPAAMYYRITSRPPCPQHIFSTPIRERTHQAAMPLKHYIYLFNFGSQTGSQRLRLYWSYSAVPAAMYYRIAKQAAMPFHPHVSSILLYTNDTRMSFNIFIHYDSYTL